MDRGLALEEQTSHFAVRNSTCAHPQLVISEKMALEQSAEEGSGWVKIQFIREKCGMVTVQEAGQGRKERRKGFSVMLGSWENKKISGRILSWGTDTF